MKTHSDPSADHSKTASKTTAGESAKAFFAPAATVQPQLTVNTPGDKFEQEADAMAGKVSRKEAPGREDKDKIQRAPFGPLEIHRKCDACDQEKIQRKADQKDEEKIRKNTGEPQLNRMASGEKDKDKQETGQTPLMRKATGGGLVTTPRFTSRLMQTKGSGQSLPHTSLQKMNQAFGSDFSTVRIHSDTRADTLSGEIQAKAFTHGSDIYFAKGQYDPHSSSGEYLLAHELTHVVQQTGTIQRRANDAPSDSGLSIAVTTAPATETAAQNRGATLAPPAPANPAQPGSPVTPTSLPAIPAAPALAMAPVEMHMPEPRLGLSETEQNNIAGVDRRVGAAVATQTTLPTAVENSDAARLTVSEPAQETQGRAQAALLVDLGKQPAPSPEVIALCAEIKRVIREKRPADEESLVKAKPDESAAAAQQALQGDVQSDMGRVQQSYDRIQPGNVPAGQPQQIGQSLTSPPSVVASDSPEATRAVPEQVPQQEISLDTDVTGSAGRIQDSGMNSETALLVETGPIADARREQGNLEGLAVNGRDEAVVRQQEAISQSRASMAELQQTALASLQESRQRTVAENASQQGGMKTTEEATRATISTRAEAIFQLAQTEVNKILPKIPEVAMQKWEAQKTAISAKFSDRLAEVKRWIDERHSGVGGFFLGIADYLTSLPGWVVTSYNDAEKTFGDEICALILDISTEVDLLIASCETLISNAETDVNKLFTDLGTDLPAWAIEEQAKFTLRFGGLREQTNQTKKDFTKELVSQAAQTVQDAREQIHALREAAKGLIGRITGFISDFINDPFRTIINGLLSLVGISKGAFWRLVDQIGEVIGEIADRPVQFCRNLMSAIAAGFELFFTNFRRHLTEGLFEWLFGKLRATGVEIPRDFSIPSIFTFFMQLMGISWQTIRRVIGRIVGERNVAMVERVVEVVGTFMTQGIGGIFEMIKSHFNPMELLETIKQKAVDFVKEAIISAVAKKIALLFIPGGAIIEALRGIYHVLKWVFENAARIFTLIESIVGGLANIIAGNIGGMAAVIEQALVRLIAPVIDFLANYLGFGNLPEHIASVVKSLQSRVEAVIERVLRVIASGAMRLAQGGANLAKKAVGAIAEFLGFRRAFRTRNGENHTLLAQQEGAANVDLVVQSTPITMKNLLKAKEREINLMPNDADKQRKLLSLNALKVALPLFDREVEATLRPRGSTERDKNRQDLREAREAFNSMLPHLEVIGVSVMVAGADLPPTVVSPNSGDFANEITADPLSNKPGLTKGSSPSQDPRGWECIKKIKGYDSNYVRLHLINEHLSGPGKNFNLTPGKKTENALMLVNSEAPAKKLVNDEKRVIWYRSKIEYRPGKLKYFAKSITVSFGFKVKNEQGDWVRAAEINKRKYEISIPELDGIDCK